MAGATLDIPTLILVGAKDEATPAADCAKLARQQGPGMAKFVAYPGAAHGFDLREFGAGTKVMGMLLAYDRNAASRSWAELRSFLAARLEGHHCPETISWGEETLLRPLGRIASRLSRRESFTSTSEAQKTKILLVFMEINCTVANSQTRAEGGSHPLAGGLRRTEQHGWESGETKMELSH